MPQILTKFGLDTAILWRGVLPDDVFFNWECSFGDKVFVVFLKEGYYQPIIDQDNYQELMEVFINKHSDFTNQKNILLTNGGDHLMPAKNDIQKNISEIKKIHNIDVEITNYSDYIKSIEDKHAYQTITGELRDNRNAYVLPNVLSTRYYLKQQNQEIEDSLKILEGLIARNYPFVEYENQEIVDKIWTDFLLNHPHDSICGCSIDEVHKEMEVRSTKINYLIQELIDDEYLKMSSYPNTFNNSKHQTKVFDDDTIFNLYNPTLRRINHFKTIKLFLNKDNELSDRFVITDGDIEYTTIIVDKLPKKIFISPLDFAPEFVDGYEYEVAFRVKDLQGLSNKNYYLKKGSPIILSSIDSNVIENQILKVTVEIDGSLSVLDKISGKTYNQLNVFYSSTDDGDTYNYSKPDRDITSKAQITGVKAKQTEYYQELHISYDLILPQGFTERHVLDEVKVNNKIECRVILYHDRQKLYFDVKYLNKAKNHRTRVTFNLNDVIQYHYSDTAFDIVKRFVRNEEFKAEKGKEVQVVVDPSQSLITTENGLTFHHLGMQEYQIVRKDQDILEVTMLRALDKISHNDFYSRGGGAGPSLSTPDAQMLGTFKYKYSLSFGEGPCFDNTDDFRLPCLVKKGHVEERNSLFTINQPEIHFSSLRKAKNSLELRVFNPTERDIDLSLNSRYNIYSLSQHDFLGKPLRGEPLLVKAKEIKTLRIKLEELSVIDCDVLVVGGGIGGVRAAVKLLEQGKKVVLTEETKWLGGQLTSQAVPLDEHPFIEEFGCTKSYREFRNNARKYYIDKYDLDLDIKDLNPGGAWVTRLAFEPTVAAQLFDDMINPFLDKNLILIKGVRAVRAIKNNHNIEAIVIENLESLTQTIIKAKVFLDATETGELLPITKTDYVVGAESKEETNELHAADIADKDDLQPVTHVAALRWNPNNTKTIEKSPYYDFFKNYKTPYSSYSILSRIGPDSATKKGKLFNFYEGNMPLWSYRRFFNPLTLKLDNDYEKTTINWPQNDYFLGNIFGDEYEDIHRLLAKELTKSLIYYVQTEAINDNGRIGYLEMELIVDEPVLNTKDGFAMYPYIRESRRIKALHTICEQDILAETNEFLPVVEKSVGIGCYHIDLHITTKSNTFFYANTWPFEIPLGAFIPVKTENLIPACKNIGTTHLTNGSFRLHPIEWNIGESAGLLASYLIDNRIKMKDLINDFKHFEKFQNLLVDQGLELHWPKDKVHII
jgi:hypothetical protein